MKSSELIRILQENPDLEVMFLSKGICNFYDNIGTIFKVRVGEYIICRSGSIVVRGDDSDYICIIEHHRGEPDIYYKMTDEQLAKECGLLPWKKAILVYIEAAYE